MISVLSSPTHVSQTGNAEGVASARPVSSKEPNMSGTLMAFSPDAFPTSSPFLPPQQRAPLWGETAHKTRSEWRLTETRGCRHGR